jgi:hypothetical protein
VEVVRIGKVCERIGARYRRQRGRVSFVPADDSSASLLPPRQQLYS